MALEEAILHGENGEEIRSTGRRTGEEISIEKLRQNLADLLVRLQEYGVSLLEYVPAEAQSTTAILLEPLGEPFTMNDQMQAALALVEDIQLTECVDRARQRIRALEMVAEIRKPRPATRLGTLVTKVLRAVADDSAEFFKPPEESARDQRGTA